VPHETTADEANASMPQQPAKCLTAPHELVGRIDPTDFERREKAGPAYRTVLREPLHIVRGEGRLAIRRAGEKLLDAYNNRHLGLDISSARGGAIARKTAVLTTNTGVSARRILNYR